MVILSLLLLLTWYCDLDIGWDSIDDCDVKSNAGTEAGIERDGEKQLEQPRAGSGSIALCVIAIGPRVTKGIEIGGGWREREKTDLNIDTTMRKKRN